MHTIFHAVLIYFIGKNHTKFEKIYNSHFVLGM